MLYYCPDRSSSSYITIQRLRVCHQRYRLHSFLVAPLTLTTKTSDTCMSNGPVQQLKHQKQACQTGTLVVWITVMFSPFSACPQTSAISCWVRLLSPHCLPRVTLEYIPTPTFHGGNVVPGPTFFDWKPKGSSNCEWLPVILGPHHCPHSTSL